MGNGDVRDHCKHSTIDSCPRFEDQMIVTLGHDAAQSHIVHERLATACNHGTWYYSFLRKTTCPDTWGAELWW